MLAVITYYDSRYINIFEMSSGSDASDIYEALGEFDLCCPELKKAKSISFDCEYDLYEWDLDSDDEDAHSEEVVGSLVITTQVVTIEGEVV